jgi:hypothetical protein
LDGAESAAAFVRANPLSDPGHQALTTQLEERVAHAEVLIAEQTAGRSNNRAVRASRREAKKALNGGLLRHVISVAALAAAERPDLFGGVRLPRGTSYRAYAAQVQGILATVTAQRDALVAHGLGETALADLEKAVAELERLTDAVFETQREHVHATADLTETVAKISALIGVLDGIYRCASTPKFPQVVNRQVPAGVVSLGHGFPPGEEDEGVGDGVGLRSAPSSRRR